MIPGVPLVFSFVFCVFCVVRFPLCFLLFFNRVCSHALCTEGGDPPLEVILDSDLGYGYFYEHLRREYCEENLMCVKVCACVCLL